MQTKIKITMAILLLSIISCKAQLAADTPPRTPETEDKCKENNSVFFEFARQKNYADASGPWLELYNSCPEYSKNIYKYGVLIVNWQIEQEKDPAKKALLLERLMGVYDNRIKYFGDDTFLPTPRILGLKALDYYNLPTPNDPLKKQAYEWLNQSIEGLGNKIDAAFLQYYLLLSADIYKKEPAHLDKLIQDYIKANDILTKNAADSTLKTATSYAQVKDANNLLIAQSKALNSTKLDEIYGAEIEKNKTNINYLSSVLMLYKAIESTESEVYFSAAVYAHKIQPTEESAIGCANMANKKGAYTECIQYLEDATKLSNTNNSKAEYQLIIAGIYFNQLKSYSKAREHARNAAELNPNNGKPYLLIGNLYASSTGIYSDDAVLAKTIYYVAVDKFIKAKQVDSSVTEEANRLINTYSKYFPNDNEVFMHPALAKGEAFTVGGWIGETTICR